MYGAGVQVGFIGRLKRRRQRRQDPNYGRGAMGPAPGVGGQVDMPLNSGRGNKWGKRRAGSTRYSMMSHGSQDSAADIKGQPFADIEEEFLHAAEFGDIHNVRKILQDYPDVNIDCIDALGRTPLRLAVKNEHLEVVEVLLEKSNQHHISEAVLQAISAGHTQIAETILKHRRYLEMWKERRKLGDTDGFFKTTSSDSQFSPDITPLILSAQKNQYEIVQLLLLRGETILKPHKFGCACQECRNKMKFDQLRLAKYRLNAYRGLASEAYISLSSKDPILTAFELGDELRRLSRVEKHFKREYRDLADQLSDYVVKLLDRIRTQKELELVLNKTGKPTQEKYSSLARFKLALSYKEKKFIAHPTCQQRVVRTWYNGMGKLERASWARRLMMTFLFILGYPFMVILHIIYPSSKGARILQFPVVKFLCHAMSFMAFIILIVVSTIESSQSVSKYRTLRSVHPEEHTLYMVYRERYNNTVFGEDFPLRAAMPSVTEIMMSLWIVGMVCQECNQLFHSSVWEHFTDLYNLLDFLLISVYISVFTLRYWVMYKFHEALSFISSEGNLDDEYGILKKVYWLNADRIFWDQHDPKHLLEGMFAVANILSFSRFSYLLPANEYLGPLQISLGRMIKDIAKFLALFTLVILAFIVGLHNLFWYYSEHENIELDLPDRPETKGVNAATNFGDVMATFRTVFWSLFGRGEPNAVELGSYDNTFTENIGYIIYGAYNIVMVTVLVNMLIAMMTRSFTIIAEDSDREWKFARSVLYMDYISHGSTLPAPLNLIGLPKVIMRFLFCKTCCCCCEQDEEEVEEIEPEPPSMMPRGGRGPPKMMNGGDSPRRMAKQGSIEGPSGGAHPSDDISAVELYEANGRVNQGFEGTNTPPKSTPRRNPSAMVPMEIEEEKLTYPQTMHRIVQRYIFDIQREAEVTEDDFEEIKQDISSFRYDLLNQLTTKSAAEEELKQSVNTILEQLKLLRGEPLESDSATNGEGSKPKTNTFEKRVQNIFGKRGENGGHKFEADAAMPPDPIPDDTGSEEISTPITEEPIPENP